MITVDLLRAGDLERASTRWKQHLIALAATIERAIDIAGDSAPSHGFSAFAALRAEGPLSAHRDVAYLPATASAAADWQHGAPTYAPKFTPREREILRFVDDRGYPPRKVAAKLQLSVQTIYTHLRNALRKQRAQFLQR